LGICVVLRFIVCGRKFVVVKGRRCSGDCYIGRRLVCQATNLGLILLCSEIPIPMYKLS